jgi:hypothetical protein
MSRMSSNVGRGQAWAALASGLVSVGLLGALVPAPAVAAPATGNIPGVPLPGPVVTGKLGGPIYDVVYSVQVPPAHVLVVSLTGTAGTDFDLYLFDSSATNIYDDPPVGEVASSTGPTSTESITCPSSSCPVLGAGTYYIDLSGATNVEGTYHLTVQTLTDTSPPEVSLSLDGGAPATNNPLIAVNVIATDDLSGVDTMSISTDGTTWSTPAPYVPMLTLNLDGPDGLREIWVRVTDRAGNLSAPAHASIVLNRVPPRVVARSPDAGGTVASLRPTISVRFSEEIKRSTWTNAGLILQDASGTVVFGTYSYDPATLTGSFTPAVLLQPGARYVLSIGSVTDLAGNPVSPLGSWTFTPLLSPSLALTATARVVQAGGAVELAGSITPIVGGPLILEQAAGAGPFLPEVALAVDALGRFTWATTVATNTWFRVNYGGSAVSAVSSSPTVRVLVRRNVGLVGVAPAVPHLVAAYRREVLTALVGPEDPQVPVTLTISRYVPARGYVKQASVVRTTSGGRRAFSWRPGPGSYLVRLSTPPTALYANGISAPYLFVVR